MNELNQPVKNHFNLIAGVVIAVGVSLFAFYASSHMVAAGDTWVALACGRYHANHGVGVEEPFSFNSHKPGPTDQQLESWPQWTHGIIRTIHPTGWINQNWLTHLTFYELVHWFGQPDNPNYNMLVVWKFALFFATAWVVYALGRVMGVTPLLAAAASCLAMVVGRTFFDIRPACWSNFFVPLYLLILALAIYRNIRYIWLLVPLVVIWANFHGGYIYVYMMMVPFCAFHLLSLMSRQRLLKTTFRNLVTIAMAAVASFVAMLIFNPYHLTNLTHTFEISVSKHAESWRSVNEWRPAFDFLDSTRNSPNPVGEQEWFGVMCILFIIVFVTWIVIQCMRPRLILGKKIKPDEIEKAYQHWPKMDLAMLAIALFTTWMAIQSRRFIAIAGPAVCPFIALLIQQSWQAITAKVRFSKDKVLESIAPPSRLKNIALGLFAVNILFWGIMWGIKFHEIYLAPWPDDGVYDSVFMRMTASNVKPIDVCKFINDNHLSGRMFNYWTEGGAIAFGEAPDPATGKIPLQLFMDGRAQAAYNHDTFQLWQYTYAGGPVLQKVFYAQRQITPAEKEEMGRWISQQMKSYNVWIILVPLNQSNTDFITSLNTTENWKTVYHDTYQLMLADSDTPDGKKLVDSILSDKAVFPNELAKNLTLCKLIPQVYSSSMADRLEQAMVKAFQLRPCPTTAIELITKGIFLKKGPVIFNQLDTFIQDYLEHQKEYKQHSGIAEKLRAMIIAADFIGRNQPDKTSEMNRLKGLFEKDIEKIQDQAIW